MTEKKVRLSLFQQPGTTPDTPENFEDVQDRQGVKSVEVAARILQALMTGQISLPLKDLSRETRLPAAKLHRYLTSLIRSRLVQQDSKTRQYKLGGFAMEIGAAAMHSSEAMTDAMRKQRDLRDAIDETITLSIWSSQGPIVIRVEESSRSVLMTVRTGTLLPICATAAGIVFSTFLPAYLTTEITKQEIEAPTGDNEPIVSSLAELEKVKALVGKEMYFVNKGHLLAGVAAIATPLFDNAGHIVGVLSAVGRQGNFTPTREAHVISHLLRVADHGTLHGKVPTQIPMLRIPTFDR